MPWFNVLFGLTCLLVRILPVVCLTVVLAIHGRCFVHILAERFHLYWMRSCFADGKFACWINSSICKYFGNCCVLNELISVLILAVMVFRLLALDPINWSSSRRSFCTFRSCQTGLLETCLMDREIAGLAYTYLRWILTVFSDRQFRPRCSYWTPTAETNSFVDGEVDWT